MELEKVSIAKLSIQERILLLRELGYDSDGNFVLNEKGEVVIDKYIDQPVKVNNMVILEGSTLILDNNPLSIASYLEDHPDVKF